LGLTRVHVSGLVASRPAQYVALLLALLLGPPRLCIFCNMQRT